MDYQRVLIVIFVTAGVMYLLRTLPLIFCKSKIKNRFIQSFLSYIPYAVLTSMTIPEAFNSTSNMMSASIGILFAVILAYFGKSLLVVALSSTAVVFIVEQVMNILNITI